MCVCVCVCVVVDDNMYASIPGVEHSGEGNNGCHPRSTCLATVKCCDTTKQSV